jgi:hypothetical protein
MVPSITLASTTQTNSPRYLLCNCVIPHSVQVVVHCTVLDHYLTVTRPPCTPLPALHVTITLASLLISYKWLYIVQFWIIALRLRAHHTHLCPPYTSHLFADIYVCVCVSQKTHTHMDVCEYVRRAGLAAPRFFSFVVTRTVYLRTSNVAYELATVLKDSMMYLC